MGEVAIEAGGAWSVAPRRRMRKPIEKLDLTNEERQALLRLLEQTLRSTRWPLSPDVEALRRIAEKLSCASGAEGDEKHKPARS